MMKLMKMLESHGRMQPDRLNARLGLTCVDFDPEKLDVTYLFRPAPGAPADNPQPPCASSPVPAAP